jgi:hypothetical protein
LDTGEVPNSFGGRVFFQCELVHFASDATLASNLAQKLQQFFG